jgi:L-arabinokinase
LPTIVYYVSGHGFGHARRTAEVLRALTSHRRDIQITVRTSAPAFIFRNLPNVAVTAPVQTIDPGVVERDTLSIDPRASLVRLQSVLQTRDEIVHRESQFVRARSADLIAADIPFLAGDVAKAAAVPCVGVGNFTWDWIYEPFVSDARGRDLLEQIRRSHQNFDKLFHLPLGHEVRNFKSVQEVPLIASQSRRPRHEIERRLGIVPNDTRPRVLIAMRGGLPDDVLFRAARQSPGFLFFLPIPATGQAADNVKTLDANTGELDFTDILSVCNAVVSKVGYGILADCIAAKTALLYPRREGFREDEISLRECPRFIRMRELARDDFVAGHWRESLRALLAQPLPPQTLPTNGDQVVAHGLSQSLPSVR